MLAYLLNPCKAYCQPQLEDVAALDTLLQVYVQLASGNSIVYSEWAAASMRSALFSMMLRLANALMHVKTLLYTEP